MASHPNGMSRPAPRALATTLLALLLAGCAGQGAFREGNELVARDQVEAGLAKYREAVAADPGNAAFRAALLGARDRAATRLLDSAQRRLAAGEAALAAQEYARVLAFDPANERARAGLRQVEADARHVKLMIAANEAFEQKDHETARQHATAVLTERPDHEPARLLMAKINEAAARPAPGGLAAAYRTPISIEFRDVALKQAFEVIALRSGLNFVFDKDVKTDARTSIFLKNSNVEAAIYFLLMSNQLEQQVMDGNTVMVYPNTAAKLREYQEQTVKTFYLANADAKTIGNTLKTIVKSRDVVIDEKLNLVIVRDSPEAIKLATKLVALQDVAEPEVMLDVEILEIKRSSITELGIAWPTTLGFAPLQGAGGAPLTIDALRGLASSRIGVSGVSASLTANRTDGDSNTLANPRIRVRNKEKAKVVIGDKVPNISATVSTNGAVGNFATESVTYVDVGLTLNVEPTIYLNNEVAIRISLEVSNVVDTLRTNSGSVAYRIGTRSASTMLQLKDGENQVLAGLINNEDRSSGSKVPGLGHLPIVGRLFGRTNDTLDKTEIVLSITPHLVRTLQRPPAGASEFGAGTEANFRRRPETQNIVVTGTAVRAPAAGTPAALPGQAPAAQPAPVYAPVPGQGLPSSALPTTPSLGAPAPAPAGVILTPAPSGVVITPIPAPQSVLQNPGR
ncbi:secretin N-terminal domain-containing protein [Massilia sp. CMS3.1]|uniref:secretin N-terminal domain-containing protein n=1 Tax=Massilia sp. CMS3.1 TaxID=3373083 RepID=UPI003EE80379